MDYRQIVINAITLLRNKKGISINSKTISENERESCINLLCLTKDIKTINGSGVEFKITIPYSDFSTSPQPIDKEASLEGRNLTNEQIITLRVCYRIWLAYKEIIKSNTKDPKVSNKEIVEAYIDGFFKD